jgi:hypothetical protein
VLDADTHRADLELRLTVVMNYAGAAAADAP